MDVASLPQKISDIAHALVISYTLEEVTDSFLMAVPYYGTNSLFFSFINLCICIFIILLFFLFPVVFNETKVYWPWQLNSVFHNLKEKEIDGGAKNPEGTLWQRSSVWMSWTDTSLPLVEIHYTPLLILLFLTVKGLSLKPRAGIMKAVKNKTKVNRHSLGEQLCRKLSIS